MGDAGVEKRPLKGMWISLALFMMALALWTTHCYHKREGFAVGKVQFLDFGNGFPLHCTSFMLGPVEIPRWESLSVEVLGIEHPIRANLGGKVSLLGYNIESGFWPGDNIHLTIFWQCLEEMEQSYTVFTHLVDAEDNIVAQKDNPPVDGFYPTTKWEVREIVRDQNDLVIPADTPLGEYKLQVGMYLAETGERLPVVGDTSLLLEDKVVLQLVSVKDKP